MTTPNFATQLADARSKVLSALDQLDAAAKQPLYAGTLGRNAVALLQEALGMLGVKPDTWAVLRSIPEEQYVPLRHLMSKVLKENDEMEGRQREELGTSDVSCEIANLIDRGWITFDSPDQDGKRSINRAPDSQNGRYPNWPSVVITEDLEAPTITRANVPIQDGDLCVIKSKQRCLDTRSGDVDVAGMVPMWEVWAYEVVDETRWVFMAKFNTKREAVAKALTLMII
jgi:hypothetical protein